jgi:hypothetical protein
VRRGSLIPPPVVARFSVKRFQKNVDNGRGFGKVSGSMADSVLSEFPFVKSLPKREKGKLAKLWEHLDEIAAVEQREGKLIQVSFASALLNVCRQRVHQLMDSGQLKRIEVNGHPFVTVRSVAEFCETERKAGRPRLKNNGKLTFIETLKTGIAVGREMADYVSKK